MCDSNIPVTEQSNAITTNIDVASPPDIVRLLGQCDEEIFEGWNNSKGLYDPGILDLTEKIATLVSKALKDKEENLILLSGCGTSGRLAFLLTRTFNKYLTDNGHKQCFDYTIAGNDMALFTSQEATEDDPHLGRQMLIKSASGKKVTYIGISCGLSAPFVAGQIDHCLNHPDKFTPILLGFNPIDRARDISVENWNQTFKQVTQRLNTSDNGYILNPIIGPEPITGSTRMKGGTATILLLEAIFISAYQRAFHSKTVDIKTILNSFHEVKTKVYECCEHLASLVEVAGRSLNQGGSISYIGQGSQGFLGILDSTECPPTFGAVPQDVSGYLDGGFDVLGNKQGDLSTQVNIDANEFVERHLPKLREQDLLVLLAIDGKLVLKEDLLKGLQAQKVLVNIISEASCIKSAQNRNNYDILIEIHLPKLALEFVQELKPSRDNLLFQLMSEIATKWVCNILSTGAHILKGKVYLNYMVDVLVRNNKLYHRAVGIIQRFSHVSQEVAEKLLLRVIYDTDEVAVEHHRAPVSQHLVHTANMHKVVPQALVMGMTGCGLTKARQLLTQHTTVRHALFHTTKL